MAESLKETELTRTIITDSDLKSELLSAYPKSYLPISAYNSTDINNTLKINSNTYVYRITDLENLGEFPLLSIDDTDEKLNNIDNDFYYSFEIEWITAARSVIYKIDENNLDIITYPNINSDGEQHTYYFAGRVESSATNPSEKKYILNCWRSK